MTLIGCLFFFIRAAWQRKQLNGKQKWRNSAPVARSRERLLSESTFPSLDSDLKTFIWLFLKVVWESQLQDAKPICGLACLVSQCVCGIPYYTSANFPDFLSAHTDIPMLTTTSLPVCVPSHRMRAHMHSHPGPDARTSDDRHIMSPVRPWQDCQQPNGPPTNPNGCPVSASRHGNGRSP